MGTPQEMLEYIVESSPSVSHHSIGDVLKCASDSLRKTSEQAYQVPQEMPRSRVAQPDVALKIAERLLTEIVYGYDRAHNAGIHAIALCSQSDCYAVMSRLVGKSEANSLKFRDTVARCQIIIGKYRGGQKCSSQEITEVTDFCERIFGLAKNYTAPEYKH